jgi:hypothetical protein
MRIKRLVTFITRYIGVAGVEYRPGHALRWLRVIAHGQ